MKLGKKIASIILVIMVFCVSFSGCAIMNCYQRQGWEQAYEYFTGRGAGKYHRVKAKMIMPNPNHHISEDCFSLDIDEEEYRSHYGEDDNYSEVCLGNFREQFFVVAGANYDILKEEGFFDLNLTEIDAYYISNAGIMWNGWCLPIVGVQIGDKVYLDEETGKANWLEYIREEIKMYS